VIGDATRERRSQREKRRILRVLGECDLGRVRLLGFQPRERLLQEARAHHLFVSPSLVAADGDAEGGAPIGLLEMAASGMPVVSTRHCDIPEALGPAYADRLAPERDVPALVALLERWLAGPEQWEEVTRACRRHLEREYELAIQSRRLAALYGGVLGRRAVA
jgi:colanic acid/amylovoran biosynthesis glycosyltransferase